MGKDQADCESAIAKRYINSFVHSGNNCLNAEEIKKGIMYLGGPKDCKVSVVEIDRTQCIMTESSVKNIQSYHSISYTSNGMTFYQYFNCGVGKFIEFSKLEFKSGLTELEPFKECPGKIVGTRSEKRKDRGLNTVLFCQDPGCILSFQSELGLLQHMQSGNHQSSTEKTSMDCVKTYYADLVQKSSHSKSIITASSTSIPSSDPQAKKFITTCAFQSERLGHTKEAKCSFLFQAETFPL